MITVKLVGGLGNQMFQYAAGRALALRCGADLLFDLSHFEIRPKRRYMLHYFRLPAAIAAPNQIHRATQRGGLAGLADSLLGRRQIYYSEKAFSFDPDVLHLPKHTCLEGYWQSEKYFADASATIRRELVPPDLGAADDANWLDRIRGCCSVSLHVRRGDYVSGAAVAAVHGTCSPDYYMRATQVMAGELGPDIRFFLFSDEPEWAMNNLRLEFAHSFVVCYGHDRDIREFRLMSACKHHVIANSTFSWWGAWLRSQPDKIVIAPRQWFLSTQHDTRDLIPSAWRTL